MKINNIIYHVLDCIVPDMEKNQYGRYELKVQELREYIEKISLSPEEFEKLIDFKKSLLPSFNELIATKEEK